MGTMLIEESKIGVSLDNFRIALQRDLKRYSSSVNRYLPTERMIDNLLHVYDDIQNLLQRHQSEGLAMLAQLVNQQIIFITKAKYRNKEKKSDNLVNELLKEVKEDLANSDFPDNFELKEGAGTLAKLVQLVTNKVEVSMKSRQDDVNNKIEDIKDRAEESVRDIHDRTNHLISETLSELDQRKQEVRQKAQDSIDSMVSEDGNYSRAIIAKEYDDNAEKEGILASKLRSWSLICMVISISILLITMIFPPTIDSYTSIKPTVETLIKSTLVAKTDLPENAISGKTKDSLSMVETISSSQVDPWQLGLRIILSLLMSVPAAYLARESSKHRIQQNAYLQIAMNVGAVKKLIGELDKDVQNQILSEMSNKLINSPVGVGLNGSINDRYPINSGELLMKMIDKLDFKQKETQLPSQDGK